MLGKISILHYSPQCWGRQSCLSMPEVGAFGEVWLHYTADLSMWPKQHAVLRGWRCSGTLSNYWTEFRSTSSPSHVLVLHARGMMSGQPGGTYLQLLYQLKGRNLDTMNQWQRVFPNTHFGFTGLVQHFNNDSKEALKQLQEEKLLLETNAPYFRIGWWRHSLPALIGMIADMVAKIRGQKWKEVLEYV